MEDKFVRISDLIKEPAFYYAHSKENNSGKVQYETLEAHTQLCQQYFKKLCESKQIDTKMDYFYQIFMGETSEETKEVFNSMWKNVVIFHDMGKINLRFQKEILGRKGIEDTKEYYEVGSKHSSLSAVIYMEYYMEKVEKIRSTEEALRLLVFIMCNAYLISRHHSGLVPVECFLAGEQREEIYKAIKVLETEYKKVFKKSFHFGNTCFDYMGERFMEEARTKKQDIWLYFYEKLLYSLLVAADYYATSEYVSGVKITDFGELDDLSELYRVFQNTEINQSIREYENAFYPMKNEKLQKIRDINVLRKEIFLETEKNFFHQSEKNIFYVEAPTGSGKSNLSLNLSFQMAKNDKNLKKIYYIYPFNTLIEQNQEIIQNTFGGHKEIMENVAVVNSITPIKKVKEGRKKEEETESSSYYEHALLNRQFFNYPMILTTHVSLFDTIFGDTKESAFGFHQLAGSILVLDEIQSYKNKIWGEMISFLTELAEFLCMKIIIMSATLPNLDVLKEKGDLTAYLVQNREKYFQHSCFKDRVILDRELLGKQINMELLLKHVKKQCGKGKKILIEFIRKGSAEEFYQTLMDEELQENIFCMTGDDSVLERKHIIEKIKSEKEKGIILVATQVIEAGVDIDMDIGYKAIAKMDSEEQFIGRINRSFGKDREGKVYFFQMDDGKNIYREDIRATNMEFSILEDDIWTLFQEKNFPAYYEKILSVWKKNYGEKTEKDFFANSVKKLNYCEVKKQMQLIEEDKWNMSLYLGRIVMDERGELIDGRKVWDSYKNLLHDNQMNYAERKVKLSEITAIMNYFIYQVKQIDCSYTEQIGELFYIEEGEEYIENGKLNRAKVEGQVTEFI